MGEPDKGAPAGSAAVEADEHGIGRCRARNVLSVVRQRVGVVVK